LATLVVVAVEHKPVWVEVLVKVVVPAVTAVLQEQQEQLTQAAAAAVVVLEHHLVLLAAQVDLALLFSLFQHPITQAQQLDLQRSQHLARTQFYNLHQAELIQHDDKYQRKFNRYCRNR
jgi:hypothetical protein